MSEIRRKFLLWPFSEIFLPQLNCLDYVYLDYFGEILDFISVSDLILCHKNEFTLAQRGMDAFSFGINQS